MAMKKTYYSVNGRIIGEKALGGTRTDYLRDALGSVIGTVDQNAQVINTYRYKPYGTRLAKIGVGADPAFGWVGEHGYRLTNQKWSDVYVRRRHDDTASGRWTTTDPLMDVLIQLIGNRSAQWVQGVYNNPILRASRLSPFIYASGSPTQRVDPSGLHPATVDKSHSIGPVPIGCVCDKVKGVVVCGDRESDHDAETACDFLSGNVWTLNCNTGCDAPCTDAHEGQHRNDLAECCRRASDCMKNLPPPVCAVLYNIWWQTNQIWRECRGYSSGISCMEKMLKNRNCWSCPPGDKCCDTLKGTWQQDHDWVTNNCKGIEGKPPMPCPL